LDDAMQRNGDRVFRVAVAGMGTRADAEDVVQDVFLKLLEKRPAFESEEHEAAWLVRVTVNMCRSRLRSPRRRQVPLLETYPARDERQHDVMETVMSLPPKYRSVIHLYYYEGYSTREIAEMTAQKDSTVREQLTRARRMLKKYMEGEQQ
jgi:RNA polymerase sigma-70 factor (ECF subfamily)